MALTGLGRELTGSKTFSIAAIPAAYCAQEGHDFTELKLVPNTKRRVRTESFVYGMFLYEDPIFRSEFVKICKRCSERVVVVMEYSELVDDRGRWRYMQQVG